MPVTSARANCFYRRWGRFVLLALIACLIRAGLTAQVLPEAADLLQFFASERQHFSLLTYAQAYMDDQHERVSYKGTLYNAVHGFALKGCEVVAQVAVEDRFSGAIQHKTGLGRARYEQTGELVDDTVYEYRFSLSALNADQIGEFSARPAEFASSTNVQCQEDRSCQISWVRLASLDSGIHETRAVNGLEDLNRNVTVIALPAASSELANDAVTLFRRAVRACASPK